MSAKVARWWRTWMSYRPKARGGIVIGIALVGAAVYAFASPADPNAPPTCNGQVMYQGEECQTTFSDGATGTQSYDELQTEQEEAPVTDKVVGGLLGGAGAITLAVAVWKRRPDLDW